MGNKRSPRRMALLLSVWLLAALFLPCAPALAADAAEAGTPVRAGYFYNGDFMHKADDGSYAGYDIEYYYTLAGYAGWDIQFVEYGSLQDAQAALKRGEIDVMSGLSRTPEREAAYLISAQKMCTSHIAVQTRADDDRFSAGDPSSMTELSCGILRASNVVALYSNWCAENGLTPHIVEFDSIQQRNAALAAGQVDAIAAGSTIAGAQKIAEFPSLDLYFMFNRDRADLKTQLDRAMGLLSLENPTYSDNLYVAYFPSSRNSVPSFSSAEKAFLAAHPVLRVAVLRSDAPFSSENADGTVSGILPEYFEHLSAVIGVTFECVPCDSKDAACAAMAAGEADLVGKAGDDIFDAAARHILLTESYLEMYLVQITRAGTGRVASAAVPECNAAAVAAVLSDAGSDIEAAAFVNSAACFAELKSGRADAVICTQPAAAWLLNRNRSSDYVISAFGGKPWDVSFGISFGSDGNTLRTILNKTIAVDDGYISQLITGDTLQDSADLAGLFDRLPVSLIATAAIVAALLLVLAVVALIILIRRRRSERFLAARKAELSAAEEAGKAKRAFFGAVSHDMRTPLNAIVGFTDLALESGDPAKVRDYLLKIQASSAVLSSLVGDTLIMSRIENGKYTLNPSPVDTSELLSGILEPIRALAAEKGVNFRDDVSVRCRRRVLADRLSLQKIIINLLSNAVKFTPPGGTVTLSCALDAGSGPEPDSIIRVADTGRGISREFLPHVFEPFSQENPADADASGSGLGLSIVKSLVDALGGTIDVQSEKGRGTAFTVRLHLAELPAPAQSVPAADGQAASPLQGKRALVCEDNALNLEIIRTILEQQGMATAGAENGALGADAFAKSAPGYFDAVLLDLRMPVMDGRDAARTIRSLNRSDARTVPILAVSADAYPEDVAECLAAGMNGHIAKPVDAGELVHALSALLAPPAPGPAGASRPS